MARRGVWTGSISFGLVSIGVKALTAVHDHDVHFHQLERGTGARIGNQKVSKQSGDPVESEDIEMGYEVSKGRYVTFERSEIEDLKPASTRVVEVSDFVDLSAIDPVYYARTYWLAPTGEAAEKAYRLLAAAMEKSQQVGIGTVVMRNKQYLAAIRPLDGALAMSTMRFADEVIDIGDIDEIPTGTAKPSRKELDLANQIIDSLSSKWDPSRYADTFTDELKAMIEAKDRGDEIVSEPDDEDGDGAEVLDLMEALKASLEDAKASRSKSSSSGKRAATKPASKRSASTKRRAASSSSKSSSTRAAKKSTKKSPARKSA